jgi:GTP-binding protein
MRASTADDKIILAPAVKFSLEESMEYISENEYLEVTPKSMRMRKIILDEVKRKISKKTVTT